MMKRRGARRLMALAAAALCAMLGILGHSETRAGTAAVAPAKLAKPVSWGSPDQPYGKRRAVTAADRAAIAVYRSGKSAPVYATNFASQTGLAKDWDFVSEDNQGGMWHSCRRPANDEASSSGLKLRTLVATDCHNPWSTGYIISKARYGFGFFEASMKIADIKGLNNAFWMTTDDYAQTGDHFEIDMTETQYPDYSHIGLQQYPATGNGTLQHTGMGWGAYYRNDLSAGFHDYGVLWRPNDMIFEIDGEPIAAVITNGSVHPPGRVELSTALIYAGIPAHPEGHDLLVRSLKVVPYRS